MASTKPLESIAHRPSTCCGVSSSCMSLVNRGELPVALHQPILSRRKEPGALSGRQDSGYVARDPCVVVAQQRGRTIGHAYIQSRTQRRCQVVCRIAADNPDAPDRSITQLPKRRHMRIWVVRTVQKPRTSVGQHCVRGSIEQCDARRTPARTTTAREAVAPLSTPWESLTGEAGKAYAENAVAHCPGSMTVADDEHDAQRCGGDAQPLQATEPLVQQCHTQYDRHDGIEGRQRHRD